jgi:DNA-binding response OmpR family regulator
MIKSIISSTDAFTDPKSVIVVDDEIDLSSLYKTFLIKEGYNVLSFSDPFMALDFFKETYDRHSLIITDMRMPGMSGIELAKKIRELNDKIKIFLITAFDISDLKNNSDFKAARIDKLIQKPISLYELRQILDNTLRN